LADEQLVDGALMPGWGDPIRKVGKEKGDRRAPFGNAALDQPGIDHRRNGLAARSDMPLIIDGNLLIMSATTRSDNVDVHAITRDNGATDRGHAVCLSEAR
jgi:hypothetical protein